MMMIEKKKKGFIILISVLSFFVYLFTLQRTVVFGDSGEFITISYILGIAHPSGYPLYVILGHLFSLIPIGSIAFRIAVMSAFFASLSVFLIGQITYKLTKKLSYAILSSGILGFSRLFWSQAVIAEVYSLMVFFILILFLVLMVWKEKKDNKLLLLFSFLYGLSFTNHLLMAVFIPAFIYFLLSEKNILKEPRLIFYMFLLFLIGLSVYLFIPLRLAADLPITYDLDSPGQIIGHIFAKNSLARTTGFRIQHLSLFFDFFISFIYDMGFFSGFFLIGIYYFIKKKEKNLLIFVFTLFIFHMILAIKNHAIITQPHFLPSYIFFVIFIGIGIGYSFDILFKAGKKNGRFHICLIFSLLILVVFSTLTYLRFSTDVDRSDDMIAYDYCSYIEKSIGPDSILIGRVDEDIFPLYYCRDVEGRMPSLSVVYSKSIAKPSRIGYDLDDLNQVIAANRIIYTWILEHIDEYDIYTTTMSHKDVKNYNSLTFPLKRFNKEKLNEWLAEDDLEGIYYFYKDER